MLFNKLALTLLGMVAVAIAAPTNDGDTEINNGFIVVPVHVNNVEGGSPP